jgi:transcriptional regulator GlxA family with amidase domain
MVWASRGAQDRINPGTGSVIGKSDYDFFPTHVADSFVEDDRSVIRTGQPMIGRIEVYFSAAHELAWSVATKFPVTDKKGKRIGIIGWVTTHAGQQPVPVADPRVAQAIQIIERNDGQPLSVEDVAAAVAISSRQLLRIFRQTMGIGIQQFMMKVRIQAASHALQKPNATPAAVASDFGFCDQSSFTRQFRRQTGMTPAAFQRRYATSEV